MNSFKEWVGFFKYTIYLQKVANRTHLIKGNEYGGYL